MTHDDWIKLALQSPVIAALVVGTFGILTVWLSLRRFRSERWWERKTESYAKVIEALYGMRNYSFEQMEAHLRQHEWPDEKEARLRDENQKGALEVNRAVSIGEFTLSRRAAEILGGCHWMARKSESYERRWNG